MKLFTNFLLVKDKSTAFTIGDLEIKWYAIIIVSAMVFAIILWTLLGRKRAMSSDFTLTGFVFTIPLAVLFARIGAIPSAGITSIQEFFDFRSGGLTIVTGILGGFLGLVITCLIYKKSIARICDLVVAPMLFAQSIGRWGNYMNDELYGVVVKSDFFKRFPLGVEIGGEWHYASFFLESFPNFIMGLFILGIIILFVPHYKGNKYDTLEESMENLDEVYQDKIKPGSITLFYIFWYFALRCGLETIKEAPHSVNGIKVIQTVSFLVAAATFCLFVLNIMGIFKLETKKMKAKHFFIRGENEEKSRS